jgi:nucleoside-diphosphate-sugar epimerase
VIGGHDTKVSKRKNALTYLVKEISVGNEIQLYDNGDFYRDYISIDDVCQAIDLVLKNGKVNEIYNISNGTPIRFADLINYVSSKLNRSHLVKSMIQPQFHKNVQVKSMYMDNNKLVSLGYVSKKSVYNILDELICTNTMN